MSSTHDACTFVAVSNTSAKLCCVDAQGRVTYPWQESGQQAQGSVNWLKNGKAFFTTQGGNLLVHVLESIKEKPHTVLSLPNGPLLARLGGDGKCLVLVQSSVPGTVHVYDVGSLLGSAGAAGRPPVVLQDHDRPILALSASNASTHIASSNAAGAVYLHEAGPGSRATLGPLPGGPALMTPKRCLAFSQTSKPLRLAAGADDGQVLVWQISPVALGPIQMPVKLRGRTMGVGFAALNRVPASLLLSCSENGQLCVADMSSFPNVQHTFNVELNVAVSCMVVREDGLMVAVGTKDGRVGLLRVEDLLLHKQNLPKMGLIKVFDLGTHLDVVDISFQRVREPRESRDASLRDSRDSVAASPATQSGTQEQQQQEGASEAPQRSGAPDSRQEPAGTRGAGPTTTSGAHAAGSGGPGQRTAAGGPAAAGVGAPPRPLAATPSGPPGPAPPGAATTGPSSSILQQHQQNQPGRAPGVPPLVIPAPAGGQQRRPSDVGGGGGGGLPTGPSVMDDAAGGVDGGGAATSPAARAGGGVGQQAAGPGASPVASPSRGTRSPRATISSGGFQPVGGPIVGRLPGPSSGGDQLATGLRHYLDDFRQEVRDLVRGLQADMVRQSVGMQIAHQTDMAALQQENRELREEVARLSKQLDTALRFGLLGQQRGPW